MALVATDTRTTIVQPDGSFIYHDFGGKLVRLPDGWVTATGNLALALSGMDRLREIGASDLARVKAEIGILRATVGPLFTVAPERVVEALDDTRFLIVSEGPARPTVHEIVSNGSEPRGGTDWCFIMLPPEIQGRDKRAALEQQFAAHVQGCRTMVDLVRVTARLFASVTQAAESISADVEMGLSWPEPTGIAAKLLRGPAAEIGGASGTDVLARLESPDALPAVDFTKEIAACA